jgi:pyridoxamine 5'-phosphate oxidase
MKDELNRIISGKRYEFKKRVLDEGNTPENPFELFCFWMLEAIEADVPEVQAMVLSTVSEEGIPASRVLYLRKFEENQFYFYGNYLSKKGKDLEANPNASLLFFWIPLERQIRITGTVSKAPESVSDEYFASRPRESQIGAWASEQSSVLSDRKELENKVEEITRRFDGKAVTRPPFWGGWVLEAKYYEFWQGRESRLHDRIAYKKENDCWTKFRLSP